ncbi:hypothetical protein HanIR_Chr08g0362131 [Helianthus annuus]|nr:hypothetical protein HanIR_Chr08g0362131 [Helianthus annuus]
MLLALPPPTTIDNSTAHPNATVIAINVSHTTTLGYFTTTAYGGGELVTLVGWGWHGSGAIGETMREGGVTIGMWWSVIILIPL